MKRLVSPARNTPFFPYRLLGLFVVLVAMLFLTGCDQTGTMVDQAYNRPLSASGLFPDGRSARLLVPGTVPQTELKVDDPSVTGLSADGEPVEKIPVPVTSELIQRGQERYDIFCSVCHGPDGHGDGKVVNMGFPQPPDLFSDSAINLTDGDIFKIIADGQGVMLPYGYRVKAPDRWAVIAYMRAMQLKGGHLEQDLTDEEVQQLGY